MVRGKPESKKSSNKNILKPEPNSNVLEIYSSSSTKQPLTNQQWIQIENFIIKQLTSEIKTGDISPLKVKISTSGYDGSKKMGFIQAKDAESKEWYQCTIAKLTLEGISFRAWSEDEIPDVYQLRLALPEKFDSIKEALVISLLVSFNPQLELSQIKLNKTQVASDGGRYFYLELTGYHTFKFIEENNLKLDFLMGQVTFEYVS